MSYKEISLIQGSPEWLSYRKTKITATDTAVIMGLNPWKTPFELWEEKLGLREPPALNDKMREGSLLEDKARDYLNNKYNSNYNPVVLISDSYEFMMASLDGYNQDTKEILEIKCGKSSHEMLKNGEIPPYYFAQMQKQMYVTGVNFCYYFSYRDDDDNLGIETYRDDAFIEKMIEAEKEFYRCMMEFTPPSLTDKDYINKDDKDWRIYAEIYKETKMKLKELEEKEKDLRSKLICLADGKPSRGHGIKLYKSIRKGNVDYDRIEILKNVNLDDYRKSASEFWTIKEEK